MNKTEAKLAKNEIRTLTRALDSREKSTARQVKKHRTLIRMTEREIHSLETQFTTFQKSTTDRIAILNNRLES